MLLSYVDFLGDPNPKARGPPETLHQGQIDGGGGMAANPLVPTKPAVMRLAERDGAAQHGGGDAGHAYPHRVF